MAKLRHFLQFNDFSRAEFEHVFARARWIKDQFKRYQRYWPLEDRTLVMIFEKQSTRTRLSFEAWAAPRSSSTPAIPSWGAASRWRTPRR